MPLDEAKRQFDLLDALIVAGKGESDEADAIRDRMDDEWYRMTEGDRQALRDYSVATAKRIEGCP